MTALVSVLAPSPQPRRAAVAPATTEVPVDRHDAYRRGRCCDCFTQWHSAGRPRCDACHGIYARGAESEPRGGSRSRKPRPSLRLVETS